MAAKEEEISGANPQQKWRILQASLSQHQYYMNILRIKFKISYDVDMR